MTNEEYKKRHTQKRSPMDGAGHLGGYFVCFLKRRTVIFLSLFVTMIHVCVRHKVE